MAPIPVKAPFASIVRRLELQPSQTTVASQQTILRLDTSPLEVFLAKAAEHIEVLKNQLSLLSQENISARQKRLDEIASQFSRAEENYKNIYDNYKAQLRQHLSTALAIFPAASDFYDAQYKALKAKADAGRFTHDMDTAKAYVTEALSFAELEQQNALYRLSKCEIKAPLSGRIKLFVDVNTPVHRGFTLGEIG